ncbi:cold shock domain-containing protein [Aestuariirhabdus litorea]|uniref:Cold shock domain-containing protein n=2 Tax=Aestuariirhabdus litorea TaxID=2528527 RepID=A0A3P3VSY4_9GAMM|nr:cold shock domain-containing protein [Aestuariirhabdus litorea]
MAQPTTLLLITVATANLLLGIYFTGARHPLQRVAASTGSVLIVIGSIMVATERFGRLDEALNIQLLALSAWLLAAGACLHLLSRQPWLKRLASPAIKGKRVSSGREEGEVKWFNVSKGFGFITRPSGDDIFVHFRSIRGEGHRTLSDGQRVSFVVTQREKGLQAEDVTPV